MEEMLTGVEGERASQLQQNIALSKVCVKGINLEGLEL